jgi:hypothetical protein
MARPELADPLMEVAVRVLLACEITQVAQQRRRLAVATRVAKRDETFDLVPHRFAAPRQGVAPAPLASACSRSRRFRSASRRSSWAR